MEGSLNWWVRRPGDPQRPGWWDMRARHAFGCYQGAWWALAADRVIHSY